MKKIMLFIIFAVSFCFTTAPETCAQRAKNPTVKKAKKPSPLPQPAGPKVWTFMNQAGTGIHQKLRFTYGSCQKIESWTYQPGKVRKLTVQAPVTPKSGTPAGLECPPFAQWENAPLDALRLPGFVPNHMEYTDPAMRQVEQLTLNEGFRAIGDITGSQIKRRQPALFRKIEDFRFDILYPLMRKL